MVVLSYKAIALFMCMFSPIEKVLLFFMLNLFICMHLLLDTGIDDIRISIKYLSVIVLFEVF